MDAMGIHKGEKLFGAMFDPGIIHSAPSVELDEKAQRTMLNLVGIVKGQPLFGGYEQCPYFHLRHFMCVCNLARISNLPRDTMAKMLFRFSLKDEALKWFDDTSLDSLPTFETMQMMFLIKWYPQKRVDEGRIEIRAFGQLDGESIGIAWRRFQGLLSKYPMHNIVIGEQVEIFFKGLSTSSRNWVIACAQGSLMDKTVVWVAELFDKIANQEDIFSPSPIMTQELTQEKQLQGQGSQEEHASLGWERESKGVATLTKRADKKGDDDSNQLIPLECHAINLQEERVEVEDLHIGEVKDTMDEEDVIEACDGKSQEKAIDELKEYISTPPCPLMLEPCVKDERNVKDVEIDKEMPLVLHTHPLALGEAHVMIKEEENTFHWEGEDMILCDTPVVLPCLSTFEKDDHDCRVLHEKEHKSLDAFIFHEPLHPLHDIEVEQGKKVEFLHVISIDFVIGDAPHIPTPIHPLLNLLSSHDHVEAGNLRKMEARKRRLKAKRKRARTKMIWVQMGTLEVLGVLEKEGKRPGGAENPWDPC